MLFVLCVLGESASAQSNYQPSPVAPRAMGMGGAGVGTVDGAAGLFYTPGSLAFGERGQLSVSGNLYGLIGGRFGQAFGPGIGETYVTIAAVPTNISIERHGLKFGKFKISERWSFGLSVLSPINFKIAAVASSKDQSALVLRTTSEFVYTVYLGVAYRVKRNLGVGVAIVTAYRQLQASFDATVDRPTSYLQASQSLTAYTVGGSVSFGVRGSPWQNVDLGLGLHLPLQHLFGWGESRERSVVITPVPGSDGLGMYEKFGRKHDLDARYALPTRITAGFAYTKPREWGVALDLHIWSPHRYNGIVDRDTKDVLTRIDLNWTVNLNVGGEIWLRGQYPLRFGFFTDRSPIRNVYVGEIANARQDMYGATISVGVRGAISDTEVGLLASGGPSLQGAVDLASGTLEETRASGYQWRLFLTYSTQLHY